MTLVGSRFDVNTRRLLEVLSRNRLSSKWLDLEGEPEAEALLRRLNVPVADLPIVVVPGGELLRNPSNAELARLIGLHRLTSKVTGADLIVVGSHGYSGIDHLLGTTAARVVNHADRSVLVVR